MLTLLPPHSGFVHTVQKYNNYLVRLFKLRVSEIVQELCCCFRVVVFTCDTGSVLHAQGHRVKEREDVRIESLLGMVSEVCREPKPMYPFPDWLLRTVSSSELDLDFGLDDLQKRSQKRKQILVQRLGDQSELGNHVF